MSPFDFLTGPGGLLQSNGGMAAASDPLQQGLSGTGPSFGNVMANMFDPSNNSGLGAVTGAIGGLFGMPTYNQRMSAAESKMFQQLSSIHETTGGDPQKTILKFLQSPEGSEAMAMPGVSKSLEKWTKLVTPPPPNQFVTGPGQQSTFAQNGRPAPQFNTSQPPEGAQNWERGVPIPTNTGPGQQTNFTQRGANGQPTQTSSVNQSPEAVQTFNALTGKIKGLTDQEMASLAMAHLTQNDNMRRSVAIDNLVRAGKIDPVIGEKIKADTITVLPGYNEDGSPNHQMFLLDKTDINSPKLTPFTPGTVAPGTITPRPTIMLPSTVPGGQPLAMPQDAFKPDGTLDADQLVNSDPNTARKFMFLRAGPINGLVSFAGNVVRWIDPTKQDPRSLEADTGRHQIDSLQASIAALGSMQNSRLHTVVEKWLDLSPSKYSDPVAAYNDAITLHQSLDKLKADNDRFLDYKGANYYSQKDIQRAREVDQAIRNVFSQMPSIPEMEDVVNHLKVNPRYGNNVTGGDALRSVAGAVGDTVKGVVKGVGEAFTGGNQPQAPRNPAQAPAQAQPIQQPPNQPQEPAQPQNKLPSTDAIRKMSVPQLKQLLPQLKANGVNTPEWEAAKARLNALSVQQKKQKAAPSQDNPAEPPGYAPNLPKQAPSVKEFSRNPEGAMGPMHPLDPIMEQYLKQRGANTFAPGEEIMPLK